MTAVERAVAGECAGRECVEGSALRGTAEVCGK